ncbi:MAG: carboxypeptidase-like regulatory domain-containing protein, partial [Phaeodactylibacter sp.]|nr:carboxypeptidase-like regulatory domain-containing protein [Phaeodactylibacter sp.]
MKLRMLTLSALLFSVQLALAQRTITGTVTDADTKEALIGANIIISGTATGTITDIDGAYSIEVPEDAASLIFSYTGYAPQELPIVGLTVVDVA